MVLIAVDDFFFFFCSLINENSPVVCACFVSSQIPMSMSCSSMKTVLCLFVSSVLLFFFLPPNNILLIMECYTFADDNQKPHVLFGCCPYKIMHDEPSYGA